MDEAVSKREKKESRWESSAETPTDTTEPNDIRRARRDPGDWYEKQAAAKSAVEYSAACHLALLRDARTASGIVPPVGPEATPKRNHQRQVQYS